jgi:hypothetical protein
MKYVLFHDECDDVKCRCTHYYVVNQNMDIVWETYIPFDMLKDQSTISCLAKMMWKFHPKYDIPSKEMFFKHSSKCLKGY